MKKILFAALLLGVTGLWSCVEDEVYVAPPSIGTVTINPAAPTANVDVTVSTTLTSSAAISSATLYYRIGASASSTQVAMTAGQNNVYTGVIPASVNTDGAVIAYYIESVNEGGTARSSEKSYTVGAAPNVVINEINGTGADADKYVEFFNPGGAAVSLSGYTLLYNNTLTWTGTAAHTIAAGGYFVLQGTKVKTPAADATTMTEGLSAKNAITVVLKNGSGTIIDEFSKGATTDELDIARIPNGVGEWYYDAAAGTKNATNGNTTAGKTKVNP